MENKNKILIIITIGILAQVTCLLNYWDEPIYSTLSCNILGTGATCILDMEVCHHFPYILP